MATPVTHQGPRPGAESNPQLRSTLQLQQHQILSLLCGTRDQTCILVLQRATDQVAPQWELQRFFFFPEKSEHELQI